MLNKLPGISRGAANRLRLPSLHRFPQDFCSAGKSREFIGLGLRYVKYAIDARDSELIERPK